MVTFRVFTNIYLSVKLIGLVCIVENLTVRLHADHCLKPSPSIFKIVPPSIGPPRGANLLIYTSL